MQSWASAGFRWRILLIRASLDCLRFRRALERYDTLTDETTWTDVLKGSKEAQRLMENLAEIYHSRFDTDTEIPADVVKALSASEAVIRVRVIK